MVKSVDDLSEMKTELPIFSYSGKNARELEQILEKSVPNSRRNSMQFENTHDQIEQNQTENQQLNDNYESPNCSPDESDEDDCLMIGET